MADVILHALVRSRETFSLPAGSQRYFFYSQTCFPVFAWHYVKLFYSLRVWHALFSLFRPAFCLFTGLSDTFPSLRPVFPFLLDIMSTFFSSLRVSAILFLFSDPHSAFLRVSAILFLFSDPHSAFLRVSAILFLFSDPHFASLRVWLVLFLFSDPERLPCSPKAACFSSIESELRFVSRFFTHFSTLLHTFFTFIRYLNHCQEEIPIDTISFS